MEAGAGGAPAPMPAPPPNILQGMAVSACAKGAQWWRAACGTRTREARPCPPSAGTGPHAAAWPWTAAAARRPACSPAASIAACTWGRLASGPSPDCLPSSATRGGCLTSSAIRMSAVHACRTQRAAEWPPHHSKHLGVGGHLPRQVLHARLAQHCAQAAGRKACHWTGSRTCPGACRRWGGGGSCRCRRGCAGAGAGRAAGRSDARAPHEHAERIEWEAGAGGGSGGGRRGCGCCGSKRDGMSACDSSCSAESLTCPGIGHGVAGNGRGGGSSG